MAQTLAPAWAAKVPGVHGTHPPVGEVYSPTPQGVHDDDPGALHVPGAQFEHDVLPAWLYVPAGQVDASCMPVAEVKVPLGVSSQVVDPFLLW